MDNYLSEETDLDLSGVLLGFKVMSLKIALLVLRMSRYKVRQSIVFYPFPYVPIHQSTQGPTV